MRVGSSKAFGVWLSGVAIGARTIRREPLLGIKRIALPASYWRYAEFRYAARWLPSHPAARVFDLGSPKDFALMLASKRQSEVFSSDIVPKEVELVQRYAGAMGIAGKGPGRVDAKIQDGRALDMPSESFDAAYSISVLEHIPDEGDTLAIRELMRIIRPGGVVVITTPFDRAYRETFVNRDVYERTRTSSMPVFYERHYDEHSLRSRLIDPSGGTLLNLEIWGEGLIPGERLLSLAGPLRAALSPFEGFLSRVALRPVRGGSARPMAAFFALQKPKSNSADITDHPPDRMREVGNDA